jgi:hypothetical protein
LHGGDDTQQRREALTTGLGLTAEEMHAVGNGDGDASRQRFVRRWMLCRDT